MSEEPEHNYNEDVLMLGLVLFFQTTAFSWIAACERYL